MTVKALRERLAKYPDDYKVVIDISTDYEEYSEVGKITPCEYYLGICGAHVDRSKQMTRSTNAVILT